MLPVLLEFWHMWVTTLTIATAYWCWTFFFWFVIRLPTMSSLIVKGIHFSPRLWYIHDSQLNKMIIQICTNGPANFSEWLWCDHRNSGLSSQRRSSLFTRYGEEIYRSFFILILIRSDCILGLVTSLASQGVFLLVLLVTTLHFLRKNKLMRSGARQKPLEGQPGFYYTL